MVNADSGSGGSRASERVSGFGGVGDGLCCVLGILESRH